MPDTVNLVVIYADRTMSLTKLCEQAVVPISNLYPQNWEGKSDLFLNIISHVQSP